MGRGLPREHHFGSTAEVADNDSQTHYQLFQSTKRRRCGDTSENASVKSACVRLHDLWEFGENDEGDKAIPSIQKGCQASFSGFRHRCTAPPTMPSLKHDEEIASIIPVQEFGPDRANGLDVKNITGGQVSLVH
jgi:hypothetical protein